LGPGSVSSGTATRRASSDTVVGGVQSSTVRSWETLTLGFADDVSGTAVGDASKSAGVASIVTGSGGSADWGLGDSVGSGGNHGGKASDGGESDGGELHFEWDGNR